MNIILSKKEIRGSFPANTKFHPVGRQNLNEAALISNFPQI